MGGRQRRSICEPIREESSPSRDESPSRDSRSVPSSPSKYSTSIFALSPISDITLDVYKRHHRPRAPPVRSPSAPHLPRLISTNTTKPIHINQPCVPLFLLHPHLFPYLSSAPCPPTPSCLRATPSMLASAAHPTSISRRPPLASLPRLCAMSSVPWSTRLRIPRRARSALLLFITYRFRCLDFFPCKAFDTEMQSFFYLFTRYLSERARRQELCASIPHSNRFATHRFPLQRLGSYQVPLRGQDCSLRQAFLWFPCQSEQARCLEGQWWSRNLNGCVAPYPNS